MNIGRIGAIVIRQIYELRRNPNHLTNMVYWPVVNIAVWGFLTLYLAHGNQLRPSLLNGLLGAAILWGLFNGFQRDMALGFLEELWSRNLVNLFASPLTIPEYL
ncbi:MAG TPA: ABC transporter permease, partial [Bradyrhizobium sp.]|nr:ABC transporter permease [Bradyrhizobium sp.]